MRIYICGDSTCGAMTAKYRPKYGWGEVLDGYLPGIRIVNGAKGGRSSRSFYEEGELERILDLLEKGDLMLIQFGGNDFLRDAEQLYTDPRTSYPEYLMRYVNGARERGAVPVLLTSVWLRRYRDGKPYDLLEEYNDAVRQLAEREAVPLVEVVGEAMERLRAVSPEETATYFAILPAGVCDTFPGGCDDNNHSLRKGAEFNAMIVAEGLKKLGLV